MILVEFIAPLKKAPHRDRILAVLYFNHRYERVNALTVEQIRQALGQARAPSWRKVNIPDVLSKSGHLVDTPGTDGTRRLWRLTPSGDGYVQDLLGLPTAEPEIEHDVGALSSLVTKIKSAEVQEYVDEALKCLQVGALRASVVFLWAGAMREIHNRLLSFPRRDLNSALLKHDPKARNVSRVDHFAYVKDKVILLAAKELGLYDKAEKDSLDEALGLRNRCGHPSKYTPGIKKVSSFIEDVVTIVFV